MSTAAVLPRILGALFYYSPQRPDIKALIGCLPTLPSLFAWRDPHTIDELCHSWPVAADDELIWQHSALFEGQGEMVAPPWGSVYQEKDNLLMGETTASYRVFLRQHGLEFDGRHHEPEDQFGLMLLAYSALIARSDQQAARILLEQFLLPWAARYLELLQQNPVSAFYSRLAQVADIYLQNVSYQQALNPVKRRIFF
ncbi:MULTISPECIES: TorD/DmsD family molecular chaperone [Tenebrionibacter/Tenebrionicola group]|jgi:TorA maturation chaperone TorD|uniref:Molecular chaperone n=2 Tax=Tenebrionibacter/Tenebrionicola group TaxID=2969848 RepID=A0A8K0XYM0_9ENTR|nr:MULTISPECIES: molecular chaperone [Tenebrionibacter/Tenebrionicola group]MBK4716808.1 molecular chaperone [Tenebrionibacter intestinalis]MBV5097345.1 molecular chaperone [Tenebrionicola larvae]